MTPALPRTRADLCGGATIAPRASVICRTFSKLLAKFPDGAPGQGARARDRGVRQGAPWRDRRLWAGCIEAGPTRVGMFRAHRGGPGDVKAGAGRSTPDAARGFIGQGTCLGHGPDILPCLRSQGLKWSWVSAFVCTDDRLSRDVPRKSPAGRFRLKSRPCRPTQCADCICDHSRAGGQVCPGLKIGLVRSN